MKNLPLLREALYYHELGFSIIPLDSNKSPLVRWRKYQEKAASSRQIKGWFGTMSISGIGILTGEASGFVAIDVDPRHGGDYSELEKLVTPTVKTGAGGRHFYFIPSDEKDLETMHFAGYDILGNGAYVVAPPSLHPNGNIYDWIRFIGDTPFLPFPKEIKEKLKKHSFSTITTAPRRVTNTKITYDNSQISKGVLAQLRALPIKQVIEGEGLIVPDTGRHYSKVTCPFHNDSDPSFSVYSEKNYAQCFSCHKRYDTINFIREYRGLEFREACFYLMEKYGIHSD